MAGHSVDDYLETIYFLAFPIGEYQPTTGSAAIASRVAEMLGVSRASAGEMLKRLEAEGLVERGEQKEAILTPLGIERAQKVVRKHRIIERFLTDFMGYTAAESHVQADELGDTFTDEMIERIEVRLGHPDRCPHGWPVDTDFEQAENRELVALTDLRPGDRATVVRTGPDPSRLKPIAPDPELRRGCDYLVAYIGVMGPQDGVDNVVKMADMIVHDFGRDDIAFTIIGAGDCFDDLVALRDLLNLDKFVEFTGRIPDAEVASILSTADVGVCPDPKNPLNDASTMNKTMEYMAFRLPVLAFDLHETRFSAGDAAVYADDVAHMAESLLELLADEPRRHAMGTCGRERVERVLAWEHQAPIYVGIYDRLLGREAPPSSPRRPS